MVYIGRLISFYRLFDLNSLVEVAHYMSYKQIVYGTLLGHSASSVNVNENCTTCANENCTTYK